MGCEMTIFVLSEYRPESIAIIWRQMCRWSSCYNSAQTKEATVRLICIQFLISAVQLSVISERNRRQRQHMNTAVAVGRGSSRPQHQYYIWRWFVNVPNENTYNVIILLHCVPVAFYLIVFVVLFFFFCKTGNEAKRTRGPVLEGDWLDHEARVPPVAAGRTDANIKIYMDECAELASGH